ncbi:Vomp family autotransporter [Bartonella heixiaziensis]|uniref:Vomp family autotransporter n=1 Tax=Bartonella heixiaziensis TaxID=1461000 RepID=UPI003908B67F
MKKLYAPQAASELKRSRFSFVKVLSLATAATFLSNVSPSFSANFDLITAPFASTESIVVAYPQSILSAYDDYDGGDKENYLTALNVALTPKVNAADDYANFLTKTLLGPSDEGSIINVLTANSNNLSKKTLNAGVQDKKPLISPQSFVVDSSADQRLAQDDENTDIINVSDFSRNDPITRLTRSAGMQRAEETNVTLGKGIKITSYAENVAIGTNVSVLARESVAIGYYAEVKSRGSIAIGRYALAEGEGSVAIGGELPHGNTAPFPKDGRTIAGGDRSVAIGKNAKSQGFQAAAVGYGSTAEKNNGVAFGYIAFAGSDESVAIGSYPYAGGQDSIAVGHMSRALGVSSIAIGGEYHKEDEWSEYTLAKANYTTVLGSVSQALGQGATALGYRAKAIDEFSIALGSYSEAQGKGAITIGANSVVSVEDGVALGRDSVANKAAGVSGYTSLLQGPAKNTESQWKSTRGAVSVGDYSKGITRQITGVAAGSEVADAVNVRQLRDLEDVVRKNGWKLSVGGANGTTVLMDGDVDFSAGSTNLQIAKGDEDNKLKFDLAQDVALTSLKAGTNTLDATGLVITGGPQITTAGIGAGSKKITGLAKGTDDTDAVNKGQLDENVTTLSKNIEDVRSIAVFYDVEEDTTEEVSTLTRTAPKAKQSSVTFGDPKTGTVALHNVGIGKITADSTDAVNGSQLYSLGSEVAKYFGGGAKYDGGTWTAPTFTVKSVKNDGVSEDKVYSDVASALSGVGSSITNVQNKLTEQVNNVVNKVEGESFVQQDKTTHLLTIGAKSEGSEINIANKTGADRTLSGVKDATKNNEAVNKGQLEKGLKDLSNNLQSDESAVVHYDKGSDGKTNYSSVTLGGKDKTAVGLHNVADGKIAKGSHDAITGGQVNTIGEDVAKFLGGNAAFKDGALSAPTYKISNIAEDGTATEKPYNDVGSAFAGLDTSVKNVNARIKEVSQGVAQDSLNWSKTAHAFVAQHEKREEQADGTVVVTQENSKITSLADGSIVVGSSDAITGGQIYDLRKQFAGYFGGGAGYNEKGEWQAPNYNLSNIDKDGKVTDKSHTNVGSAFEGLDDNIKTVNARIKEVSEGVAQDSLNWSKTAHAFVAQHEKKEEKDGKVVVTQENSKITSLADGSIVVGSSDAITGGQIYDLRKQFAGYFGGGAGYNKEGKWIAPTFKVKQIGSDGHITDETYQNVADAFSSVGNSFESVHNEINTMRSDSLVKWNEEKKLIKIGGEKDGTTITVADKDSKDRILSGVKDAEKGNEAVNKAQLDKNIDALTNEIEEVRSVAVFYDEEEDTEEVSTLTRTAPKAKQSNVTFGDPKTGPVGLHNVGTGKIAKDSHDAINGSQLFETNDKVATYLGGGSAFKEGSLTAPTYKISNITDNGTVTTSSYNDVGSAFAGLDASVKNVNTHLTNEVKNFTDKVTNITQKFKGDALLWSDTAHAFVAQHEKKEEKEDNTVVVTQENSKLTSLLDGAINDSSTDAVTGNQLHKLGTGVAKSLGGNASYAEGKWSAPTFTVKSVKEDGKTEDKDYHDVATAFAGVGTSFSNVNNSITNIKKEVTKEIADAKSDSLNWSKTANAFVAQHEKKEKDNEGKVVVTQENSKITSLQAGKITADSTDAVNGSQLYSLGSEVAKSLGGGAGYANGTWTAPSFVVSKFDAEGKATEEKYDDVAAAFAGVSSSITNIHNEVNKEINKVVGDSLVKQDKDADPITIGKETDGTVINVANKSGVKRVISGVDDAKDNNDAVNKGQLEKGLKDLSNSLQSDESAVVHYDKQKDGKVDYANVTFGGKDKTAVGLHNIADGKIAKDSRDAITGGQINIISQEVAKFLGGNAAFKDGALSAPTYKISNIAEDGTATENSYNDVGSAFAGLDTNFKNVNTHLTNVVNEFTEKVTNITQEVQGDALLWNKDQGAFVAQHEKREEGDDGKVVVTQGNSKITSLAAGKITADSTDAVNGSQIYSMSEMVGSYFGGGAGYDKEGKWIAPTFTIKTVKDDGTEEEKKYNTVAEAFAGVGTSFTNVKNDITNVVSNSLVKWNEEQKIIKIGGEKEGGVITLADNKNTARTLSGVKDAEKNDEAVNKGQLDENVTKLSDDIEEVRSVAVLYDEEEASEEVSTLTRSAPKVNKNSVTFGDPKTGTVALHNVAAGKIVKDSHDVINGGQIETITQNVAKFLGGDTAFSDGAFTGPTYKLSKVSTEGEVAESEFKDVGTAFAGLDTNIKNVNQRIKEVSEGVAQDSLLWSDTEKAFVAQHGKDETAKTNSKIKFLANGEVSESSTEAVNGSQLYSLNTTLAKYFGGNAKYENGAWTAPIFKVTTFNDDGSPAEQEYESVAAAFAGVSSSFTKLHNEISDNIEQNALLWSDEESAFVALHGKEDARSKSKLKSLLDGDISEGSTEAMTGNQLYLMSNQLSAYFGGGAGYKAGEWTAPTFNVAQFNSDGSSSEKKIYNDVASAFDGVSDSMSSINDRIKEVSDNRDTNSLNWNEDKGSYDASHKGASSKITNVAGGKIEEGSQEVVNGGQLWTVNEKVKEVETKVDTIDQQVKDITTAVTDGAVNYDKDADGKKTNSITLAGGNESEPVLIANVKDGKIEEGSKQAVNGGQLHDYTEQQMKTVLEDAKKYTDDQVNGLVNNGVNEAKSYTDMKFETLNYAIEDVRKEARQAAAIGLAVSNLSYDDTPGKLSFSFGSGLWRSQSAFAIGAGYMSENGRFRSNISATSAGGHWGVGAGFRVTLN